MLEVLKQILTVCNKREALKEASDLLTQGKQFYAEGVKRNSLENVELNDQAFTFVEYESLDSAELLLLVKPSPLLLLEASLQYGSADIDYDAGLTLRAYRGKDAEKILNQLETRTKNVLHRVQQQLKDLEEFRKS